MVTEYQDKQDDVVDADEDGYADEDEDGGYGDQDADEDEF